MDKLIYALKCPITGNIHYIGKSTQGMIRPMQHMSNSHSSKVKAWVSDLSKINYRPDIEVIEKVSLTDCIDDRERYWIQHHINKGANLLNSILVTPIMINPDLDVILGEVEGIEEVQGFIKHRKKSLGFTQQDLADKAGVALTVVRKIEQGKTNFNVDGLLSILRLFGCTLTVTKLKR